MLRRRLAKSPTTKAATQPTTPAPAERAEPSRIDFSVAPGTVQEILLIARSEIMTPGEVVREALRFYIEDYYEFKRGELDRLV